MRARDDRPGRHVLGAGGALASRPIFPLRTFGGLPGRTGALIRGHWLLAAFVLLAVGIRVLASIAYWPGIEFWGDSYDYLRLAHLLVPGTWHPSGYPILLRLLSFTGQLGVVVVVQHLMGIAMGVLVYVLALRLTGRRWLAAIAAVPVLFDGYQLDLEQMIMAETLTDLLLLGGLVVIVRYEQVTAARAAAAGLLLGAAVLTRTALLPVLVLVALYLLIRSGRWRGLLAFCAVAATLLIGYGAWYGAANGSFGYSAYTGFWLYGRVAPFATCNYALPRKEAQLCPKTPVARRTQNNEYFADVASSPINAKRYLGTNDQRNALGQHFAIAVIEHQPLDYLSAVLADTWHYFTPGRWMTWDRVDMRRWRFPPPHINPAADEFHIHFANRGFNRRRIVASPDPSLMATLRTYQSFVYMPGPAFLACLIVALAVGVGLLRRRSGRRDARWAGLLLAVTAIVVLVSPSLITGFSYRYALPLLVLLPPAGAAAIGIGLDALAGNRLFGRVRLGTRDRFVSDQPIGATPELPTQPVVTSR